MREGRRRRCAAAGAAVVAVLLSGACSTGTGDLPAGRALEEPQVDGAPAPRPTRPGGATLVADLGDLDRYVGEEVAVQGRVRAAIDGEAFTLVAEDAVTGDPLLVVGSTGGVEESQTVTVTGTVREAYADDVLREDLEPEVRSEQGLDSVVYLEAARVEQPAAD